MEEKDPHVWFIAEAVEKPHGLWTCGSGRKITDMNWTELITVRSSRQSKMVLQPALQELVRDVAKKHGPKRIRIFHRQTIDTDFCVILSHEKERVVDCGSRLGLRIAAALKVFGLVNHTVWSEIQ